MQIKKFFNACTVRCVPLRILIVLGIVPSPVIARQPRDVAISAVVLCLLRFFGGNVLLCHEIATSVFQTSSQ